MNSFDTIVVGLGAKGSATLYHLRRRGQRVLGLEAFPAGHRQGSSHGESRVIGPVESDLPVRELAR